MGVANQMASKAPYEFLEHTADIKIRAHGQTLEEAFTNVAKGMVQSLTDEIKVKKVKKVKICIFDNDLI